MPFLLLKISPPSGKSRHGFLHHAGELNLDLGERRRKEGERKKRRERERKEKEGRSLFFIEQAEVGQRGWLQEVMMQVVNAWWP